MDFLNLEIARRVNEFQQDFADKQAVLYAEEVLTKMNLFLWRCSDFHLRRMGGTQAGLALSMLRGQTLLELYAHASIS